MIIVLHLSILFCLASGLVLSANPSPHPTSDELVWRHPLNPRSLAAQPASRGATLQAQLQEFGSVQTPPEATAWLHGMKSLLSVEPSHVQERKSTDCPSLFRLGKCRSGRLASKVEVPARCQAPCNPAQSYQEFGHFKLPSLEVVKAQRTLERCIPDLQSDCLVLLPKRLPASPSHARPLRTVSHQEVLRLVAISKCRPQWH